MAVSDNYAPARVIGNGVTTEFTFTWEALANSFVVVNLEAVADGTLTPQVEGVDYTLERNPVGGGGTVTYTTPPTSAYYSLITRTTPLTQTVPYKTSTGFDGSKQEFSFDKVTNQLQESVELSARAIKFPIGDPATGDLPASAGGTNKYLFYNGSAWAWSSGTTDTPISTAMEPVVSAITIAASRAIYDVYSKSETEDLISQTPIVTTYTLSNTHTLNADTKFVVIECIGGGGGGGGASGTAGSNAGSGGGGAGGYSKKTVSATTFGASQIVTIGTGGAGGTGAVNGTSGTATSVGSLCVANGGTGGVGAVPSSSASGGLGGSAGTGDVTGTGDTGATGTGAGNISQYAKGGKGGSTFLGGGGREIAVVTPSNGNDGIGYGAGGSGCAIYDATTTRTGGSGASGYVIITEYK